MTIEEEQRLIDKFPEWQKALNAYNAVDWTDYSEGYEARSRKSKTLYAALEKARTCPDCNKIMGEMGSGGCKCEHTNRG